MYQTELIGGPLDGHIQAVNEDTTEIYFEGSGGAYLKTTLYLKEPPQNCIRYKKVYTPRGARFVFDTYLLKG